MTQESIPTEIRRERIATRVQSEPFVRVDTLSEEFGISEVTVRSDLAELEREGSIRRVRGGAAPTNGTEGSERSFEESLTELSYEKSHIGEMAAAMVRSGMKVMLDVGTTSNAVAQALVARRDLEDVVVITNGVNIAMALEETIPRFTVVVTGGTLRPLQHSLVDPLGAAMLENLFADICFVGCNGIDLENGITNANIPEAAIKQRMIAGAHKTVVVADSSKIGKTSAARIAGLADIDTIITDRNADRTIVDGLNEAGIEVMTV